MKVGSDIQYASHRYRDPTTVDCSSHYVKDDSALLTVAAAVAVVRLAVTALSFTLAAFMPTHQRLGILGH
jgi:hypothetical protein